MKDLSYTVVTLHDVARSLEGNKTELEIARKIRKLADSLSDQLKRKKIWQAE